MKKRIVRGMAMAAVTAVFTCSGITVSAQGIEPPFTMRRMSGETAHVPSKVVITDAKSGDTSVSLITYNEVGGLVTDRVVGTQLQTNVYDDQYAVRYGEIRSDDSEAVDSYTYGGSAYLCDENGTGLYLEPLKEEYEEEGYSYQADINRSYALDDETARIIQYTQETSWKETDGEKKAEGSSVDSYLFNEDGLPIARLYQEAVKGPDEDSAKTYAATATYAYTRDGDHGTLLYEDSENIRQEWKLTYDADGCLTEAVCEEAGVTMTVEYTAIADPTPLSRVKSCINNVISLDVALTMAVE